MKVDCPNCKKKVIWEDKNPFRPFCSKRCQLIDFGKWNDEQHKIPAEPGVIDLENMSDEELQAFLQSKVTAIKPSTE